jgi:hypothetical protein
MKHTRQALEHTKNLTYGTGRGNDDIAELGHEAINGVVTVGTVGITAGLMGATLGSFPKP